MTGRRGNSGGGNRNFGGSPNKKQGMQNQNRNRGMPGGKSNSFGGGGVMNQVSPWLSQNNSFNQLRGIDDQQAQLALASSLLNNLLSPRNQLNKLAQPPPLLSLVGAMNSSSSSYGGGSSSGFNRDRFGGGFGRQNAGGKLGKRDDFKKGDFKNKRFGNDRKNFKKSDQASKKSNVQKNAEKKDVAKKEEVKPESMDVDQSLSEKPGDTNAKPENELQNDESTKAEEKKQPAADEVKVSYSEIPAALLFCHICRKHMWDDTSFEKHLEGRPHKMMVEELDRSYKLKVELLRHEMRVMEQQRENDIQRAQRKGKSNVKMQQRDFCTMCNLSFLGMLPAHRKNERHQRLKKFLHPKCNICSKEFYTRLEWDDHKLTPAHLKRLAEIRKELRPDLENAEFDIIDFIEDINDEFDLENIDMKVTGKRESLDELKDEKPDLGPKEADENAKDEDKEEKAEEDEETKKLPKYSPGIPVGENFVVDKSGYLCRACNRFMLSQEDNKIHCQTVIHYNNIIKILKAQNKIVRKRRLNESKLEENEEKATDTDQAADSGVNKRRKVDNSTTELNGELDGSLQPKEEPGTKSSGAEKYDPEDPESENEKEQESDVCKTNTAAGEPKVVIDDVSAKPPSATETPPPAATNLNPVKEVEPVATTPNAEEKKNIRSPAPRGPRARRGRRH